MIFLFLYTWIFLLLFLFHYLLSFYNQLVIANTSKVSNSLCVCPFYEYMSGDYLLEFCFEWKKINFVSSGISVSILTLRVLFLPLLFKLILLLYLEKNENINPVIFLAFLHISFRFLLKIKHTFILISDLFCLLIYNFNVQILNF